MLPLSIWRTPDIFFLAPLSFLSIFSPSPLLSFLYLFLSSFPFSFSHFCTLLVTLGARASKAPPRYAPNVKHNHENEHGQSGLFLSFITVAAILRDTCEGINAVGLYLWIVCCEWCNYLCFAYCAILTLCMNYISTICRKNAHGLMTRKTNNKQIRMCNNPRR